MTILYISADGPYFIKCQSENKIHYLKVDGTSLRAVKKEEDPSEFYIKVHQHKDGFAIEHRPSEYVVKLYINITGRFFTSLLVNPSNAMTSYELCPMEAGEISPSISYWKENFCSVKEYGSSSTYLRLDPARKCIALKGFFEKESYFKLEIPETTKG